MLGWPLEVCSVSCLLTFQLSRFTWVRALMRLSQLSQDSSLNAVVTSLSRSVLKSCFIYTFWRLSLLGTLQHQCQRTLLSQTVCIRRVKWRHSNLWSQHDLYVVGQQRILCEVQWSLCSNKIESVTWISIITILLRKWCHNIKHFLELAHRSWQKNSWRR